LLVDSKPYGFEKSFSARIEGPFNLVFRLLDRDPLAKKGRQGPGKPGILLKPSL
jgi:hypothetical protein